MRATGRKTWVFTVFSEVLGLSNHCGNHVRNTFIYTFLRSVLSGVPVILTFMILDHFTTSALADRAYLCLNLKLTTTILIRVLIRCLDSDLRDTTKCLVFTSGHVRLNDRLQGLPVNCFASNGVNGVDSILDASVMFVRRITVDALNGVVNCLLSSLVLLMFVFCLGMRLNLVTTTIAILT